VKVYTGNISPLIDSNGRELYVLESNLRRFNEYVREMLNILNEESFGRVLEKILTESPNALGIAKALKLVNDVIVTYYKRLFTTAPLPPPKNGSTEAYVLTPADLLYSTVMAEDMGFLEYEAVREFIETPLLSIRYDVLEKFNEATLRLLGGLKKVFKVRSAEEVYRDFIDIVMSVPADTRPGLNTSKLIPHVLLTSAIATTRYLSTHANPGRLDESVRLSMELLRISALLHDVGKPESWERQERHSRVSAAYAEKVLSMLSNAGMKASEKLMNSGRNSEAVALQEGLKTVGEVVLELIRRHHTPGKVSKKIVSICGARVDVSELANIINTADRAASASDRLTETVADILTRSPVIKSKGLSRREILEKLYGTGSEVWGFWREFSEEEVRSLTEFVAQELGKSLLKPAWEARAVEGIYILALDVRAIQEFIRRESLKAMVAASTSIDFLTLYLLPHALTQALHIPLESIVFSGGGLVLALVPRWADDDVIEKTLTQAREGLGAGVDVAYAKAPFTIPWILTQRKLYARLAARKALLVSCGDIRGIRLGTEVICESCGRRPASENVKYLGKVCSECSKLHEFGRHMYISYKLSILERLGYGKAGEYLDKEVLDKLYVRLMEWLSGARDYVTEGKYIAAVKLDCNSIGTYMAGALSPSEAYLRSIRVDLGTKLGIYKLFESIAGLSKLGKSVSSSDESSSEDSKLSPEDLLCRVFSGVLYAGGDDLLAILPSSIAIPAVISVAYWFWKVVGSRVVSAGIACGKPKHNVWALIDTADELLHNSKKLYRVDALRTGSPTPAILYIHFELGTQQLLPTAPKEAKRLYQGTGLYREPYVVPLSGSPSMNSLIRLLNLVLPMKSELLSVNDENIEALVRDLLMLGYGGGTHIRDVKDVRDVASNMLIDLSPNVIARNYGEAWPAMVAKLARLATNDTNNKPRRRLYGLLAEYVVKDYELTKRRLFPPLRDLLVLTNILLGGGP